MALVEIDVSVTRVGAHGALYAVDGADVTVQNADGSARAVYADEAGQIVIPQPLKSRNGRIDGYVELGAYLRYRALHPSLTANPPWEYFMAGGPVGPVGPTGPAGPDNTADLQVHASRYASLPDALAAAQTRGGGEVILSATVSAAASITIPAGVVLNGDGLRGEVVFSNVDSAGFILGGSGAGVKSTRITGPHTTDVYAAGSVGVSAVGTLASPRTSLLVWGNVIKNWGESGVFTEFVADSTIDHNRVERCGRDGVRAYSTDNTSVDRNRIHNIAPGVSGTAPFLNVYGVTFTRRATLDPTQQPPSRRCHANHNVITDCRSWKALDTHGGEGITFKGNIIRRCAIGIGVDEGDTSGFEDNPPKRAVVVGNVIEAGDLTDIGPGILALSTSAASHGTDLTVRGNVIDGHGGATALPFGAIGVSNFRGVSVGGNTIRNARRAAVGLKNLVEGTTIQSNAITDLIMVDTVNVALLVESATVDATVDGNTYQQTTGTFVAYSLVAPNAGYGVKLGAGETYRGTMTKFGAGQGNVVGGAFANGRVWARVDGGTTATLQAGHGVASVTRTAIGVVRVVLAEPFASMASMAPIATVHTSVGRRVSVVLVSTTDFDVYTFDADGTARDVSFFLTVFGL